MGCLNNVAEVLFAPAPADLPKFLQPTPTALENELMPKMEPIPEPKPLPKYDPLLEFEPMSPDLPPFKPIVLEVPVIEISLSDSPVPVAEPLSMSDPSKSDPSEATSTIAN